MIRGRLSGAGLRCALWVGSLAAAAAPASAIDPDGPMLFGPFTNEVIESVTDEPVSAEPAAAEPIREARRLLIDLPGGDPLSAAASELLLFGTISGEADEASQSEPVRAKGAAEKRADEKPLTIEKTALKATPIDAAATPLRNAALPGNAAEPAVPVPGLANPAQLSPEMHKLCDKVRTVLARNYPRHQSARLNTPWEVMHAIIAFGVDTQIYKDGPGSEKVNGIGYMCYNYPCRDQRMLLINRGKIDASRGVGVQGHGGQFLAILAQSHVKLDYPMMVEGKKFTLKDLLNREMETCVAGEELTFKLIAAAHYLDSDTNWSTPDGQKWSVERLVREELKAPIRGAACGGTHRLMGYAYAVRKRSQQGKELTGDFKRAQLYLRDYHRYTFNLQNPDGSFSTAWFERKANDPSVDRRLKTSGHILEWISFSLSDEELRDPRMVKAVDYVASMMLANDGHTWEIGPLGHALHALLIYEQRVFKDVVPMRPSPLVEESSAKWLEARRSTAH